MSRRASGKKAEKAEFVENEVERNRQFTKAGRYVNGKAETLRQDTQAVVATVVVSEDGARRFEYAGPSMPEVLARAGYEPRNPMANFRATNDPNLQGLSDDQLELLWQQTSEARANVMAEQNRPGRGNN